MSKASTNTIKQPGFFPMVIPNAFSEEEIASIINIWKEDHHQGTIETKQGDQFNQQIRRSKITRVDIEKHAWIMQRFQQIFQTANSVFNYDLTDGIIEPCQIAAYSEEDEGTYGWHLDIGQNSLSRKISASVPLNGTDDFEGGDLVFNYGKPTKEKQTPGNAIVFPSFALHQVKPVTKGVRYSLVSWVHGPNWR